MLLPEIRRSLKSLFEDKGDPISLNLKSVETLDPDDPNVIRKFPRLREARYGDSSWSGEPVTRETALGSPTIYACNQIVAGTIGYIGATLMQMKGEDRRDATEHPMFNAMKYEPNDEMPADVFIETLTSHCMLSGNGYAEIIRRSGTGIAFQLRPILPECVSPDRDRQRRLVYTVKEPGVADKTYTVEPGKLHNILHLRGIGWDGLKGYSVLHMVRQSIGLAIAADKNVSLFYRNGGRVPYGVEKPKKFGSDIEAKKFREDLRNIMSMPHEPYIFDQGDKYVKIGLNMQEQQAVEFRQALIGELCRPFLVTPHLVGDLSRATFSNIEELALFFEKITLSRWLERWQKAFRHCVLTPAEKSANFYLYQNLDKLRRGDFAKRMEGYASALQNGHMTIDEVRALEDRNRVPNGAGAHHHIQVNMGTIGKDGQVESPKTTGLVRLDS